MQKTLAIFGAAAVGWVATLWNFLITHGLATACGFASLVLTIYGIRVAATTLKIKQIELRRKHEEDSFKGVLTFGPVLLVFTLLFSGCASGPLKNFGARLFNERTEVVPVVSSVTNEFGAVSSVTNAALIKQLVANPVAQEAIRQTGEAIGGAVNPLLAGVGGAIATGLYGLVLRVKNKRLAKTNVVLAQNIETARELIKETSGDHAEAEFTKYLVHEHGRKAVLNVISELVKNNVSNESARLSASLIASTVKP